MTRTTPEWPSIFSELTHLSNTTPTLESRAPYARLFGYEPAHDPRDADAVSTAISEAWNHLALSTQRSHRRRRPSSAYHGERAALMLILWPFDASAGAHKPRGAVRSRGRRLTLGYKPPELASPPPDVDYERIHRTAQYTGRYVAIAAGVALSLFALQSYILYLVASVAAGRP